MNEVASAVASVISPNNATAKTSAGLRPILSAIGPNAIAPIAAPNSPAENAQANVTVVIPSASRISGAATPIPWLHTPSSSAISAQSTNTLTWSAEIGRSSIRLATSTRRAGKDAVNGSSPFAFARGRVTQ